MSLGQSIRTGRFWCILGVMALGAGSLTAVFTHVVALLTDHAVTLPVAMLAVSVIALIGSGWQLVLGHVLDRTASLRIMAPFFLLAVPGLAMLAEGASTGTLLAGAGLTGLAIGTDDGAIPYVAGRCIGLRAHGRICGSIFGINVIVPGTSPFLTDMVYDRTGSYHLALPAIGACLVLCLMLPSYGAARTSMPVLVNRTSGF